MAENGANVYDVLYPSPIPLADLSSIAVALELCHLVLNQYREKGEFGGDFHVNFEPEVKIALEKVLPDLPSVIHQMIEKYVENLAWSTEKWLRYNYNCIFQYHRDNENEILKDFDDIVCDFDGSIHYDRTAKRMMLCDRISPDEKFKIACTYSFEDDIRRIGPSVEGKVNLEEITFDRSLLYYWVCLLRNELDKIPNEDNIPIADLMLENTPTESRTSFEYFWNLVGLEMRYKMVKILCQRDEDFFMVRFVLPKLNEEQLTKFVNGSGLHYMTNEAIDELFLFIWMYTKDKINENTFTFLIRDHVFPCAEFDCSEFRHEYLHKNACQVWTSASDKLKRFAIEQFLSNEQLLEEIWHAGWHPRDIKFLLTILLDMSLEKRNIFWRNNWLNLTYSTRAVDVHRIMKLCFANDDEIRQFKKNTMAKYENITKMLKHFSLRNPYMCFELLSDAFNFIFSEDQQSVRDVKRKLLQQSFFSEHPYLRISKIFKMESFLKFIDDAFADQASEFRNKFLSTPDIENQLLDLARGGHYLDVTLFLDSLESRGSNVVSMKQRIADELRELLINCCFWGNTPDELRKFLLWCLGSDDSLTKLKESISPDEVFRNICVLNKEVESYQENETIDEVLLRFPNNFEDFLLWYFDSEDEINEFKARKANIFSALARQPY